MQVQDIKAIFTPATAEAIQTEAIALYRETLSGAGQFFAELKDEAFGVAFKLPRWNRQAGDAVQAFTVAAGRFLWGAILVAIGLVLLSVEYWQNRDGSTSAFRAIVKQAREVIAARVAICRETGAAAIEGVIVMPATDAARALTGQAKRGGV